MTHEFSRRIIYRALGLVLTTSGAVGGFIVLLQPWRSCPEIDDSSAGCPATPDDQSLLGIALFVLVVGVVFLVKSMAFEHLPSDASGRFGDFP